MAGNGPRVRPVLNVSGTVTATPAAVGTALSVVTAATTNATSSKASAATLYELTLSNPTATAAYVKLYNKASAPTVGTDIPIATFLVGAGLTVAMEFGPVGKRFPLGLAIAVTAAAPATDVAVAVAGVQISGTYI